MKYLVIIILLTFSTPAIAGFHSGTSLTTSKTNNSHSYNIGYSKPIKAICDNCILDLTTNVLYPTKTNFNMKGFRVKNKVNYVAALLGYKFDRLIVSPLVSIAKVDNKVYYGNSLVEETSNYGIVFGGNATYFITQNTAGSIFVLLPNTNIDLKLSSGFGVNFYF